MGRLPAVSFLLVLAVLPPAARVFADPAGVLPSAEAGGTSETTPVEPPEKEDDGADAIGEVIPWSADLLVLPEGGPESEGADMPEAGGGLFPPEVWPPQPGEGGEREEPPQATPTATPGSYAGIDAYTRRADGVAGQALHDPAGLLPPERSEEVTDLARRWLNEQCAFRTVVVMLPPSMRLPADFDPRPLHREWFGAEEGNGLMILYFHGRPDRALGVFSSSARATYGAERLRAALDSSAAAAVRDGAAEPVDQLERFCQEMAMDLHRMVKAGPPPSRASGRADGGGGWRAGHWILVVLPAAAAGGAFWRRRRRVRARDAETPVLLPELDYRPRLGAPHCGGFTAVLIFGPDPKAALKPEESRAASAVSP